jgi:RNA polymerase sigma-70 factor (ECF subfamily)
MANDDTDLARDAAAGDAKAVESLLVQHLPSLVAYVRLQAGPLVRARESISDLVQSVCVEVLRDAQGFEYQGDAQFRRWLHVQVLHKIQNRHRDLRAARRDVLREVPAEVKNQDAETVAECYATLCTPSQVAMGRERMEAMEAAFATLPADQQQAVLMRRVVGLSYAAIGEQLGKSEGAVRNLVYRGVAQLAARMGTDSSRS